MCRSEKKNSNAVSCVTVVVVVVVAMVVTAVVSPFYSMRNCIASAVLAIAIPSVCLSVRLSHAGIVS